MPWEPGQSGNKKGTRDKAPFYAALHRAITQEDGKRVRAAAEKLLDLAAQGEPWAVKELRDTLDGKPAQIIAGDDDNPLTFVQKIQLVALGTDSQG